MVLGKLDSDMQKNEHGPFSYTIHTYTHTHTHTHTHTSKSMKDLNIRQEAIKILEDKAGKNLFDLAYKQLSYAICL